MSSNNPSSELSKLEKHLADLISMLVGETQLTANDDIAINLPVASTQPDAVETNRQFPLDHKLQIPELPPPYTETGSFTEAGPYSSSNPTLEPNSAASKEPSDPYKNLFGANFRTTHKSSANSNTVKEKFEFLYPQIREPLYVYPSPWQKTLSWVNTSLGLETDTLPEVHIKHLNNSLFILRKSSTSTELLQNRISAPEFTAILHACVAWQGNILKDVDLQNLNTGLDVGRVMARLDLLKKRVKVSAEINRAVFLWLGERENGARLAGRFAAGMRQGAGDLVKRICVMEVELAVGV